MQKSKAHKLPFRCPLPTLQQFMNPNDIGTAAETLLTKVAEVPPATFTQLKRDFCGILTALQDDSRSSGEKRTIITNALARFS